MISNQQRKAEADAAWMPLDEYRSRTTTFQAELANAGIAAAVITSAPNFHYFTGIHSPSFLSNARPQMCVIPAAGSPVVVVSASQTPNAVACTWIDDISPFYGFEAEGIEVLMQTLQAMDATNETIGFELGSEHRLGMTVSGFDSLKTAMTAANCVDVSSYVWALRTTKSDREIEQLRVAVRGTATAMEHAISLVRPGSTEATVKRDFSTALIDMGLDPGYIVIHSGVGNYDRVNADPGSRELEKGDLLWMDGGGIFRGYRSDITRLVSMGEPTLEARSAYERVHRLTSSIVSRLDPGMKASELMSICSEMFDEEGQTIGSATRIGHGVGLELTEPPSIFEGDSTTLDSGMCLAVEPGIATPYGYFVLEEEVVVTSSGVEMISPPNAKELRAI